jgi:hypothetical protein
LNCKTILAGNLQCYIIPLILCASLILVIPLILRISSNFYNFSNFARVALDKGGEHNYILFDFSVSEYIDKKIRGSTT